MRVASTAVALAYCMGFVVVCLGACLAAAPEHGCCEEGPGFTAAGAASIDCCQVTSGVSSKVNTSATEAPVAAWLPQITASPSERPPRVPAVQVASSPPLVLRV